EARINAGCGEYLSPAEIMELVEALEKAQQRIAELEQKHCGGALMERELAHSEVINKLMSEIDNRDSRIAELESRTVTVKLTDINEYLAEVHDKTLNRAFRLLAEGVRAGDVAAMRTAGIKVEAE
ncbi:hypothetical protein, partial [Klebsiella quasipneumoniae]|uniref:hypothetical protein n=1 Tax=Klebsiella quasipneumoniae TaxID=1463165 RepID=UPI00164AAB72